MDEHSGERDFRSLDLFLPSLAYEEDILEKLSHVCQSLERHNWTKIDNISLTKWGYKLIVGCAHDPKIFEKCIKAIATALQVQTYYGYEFDTKEITDFGHTYRFIIPTQNILKHNPGLVLCENALYACRLFDRILQKGLKNQEFHEDFQARFKELFAQASFGSQGSIQEFIDKLYPDRSLLPFIDSDSSDQFEDFEDDITETTSEDFTDYEVSTRGSSAVFIRESISNQDLSPFTKGSLINKWLYMDDENLLEIFLYAYRLFEANGSYTSHKGAEVKDLLEACISEKKVLRRCLETIEHVLQYLQEHNFKYQKKYHTSVGYVYTLKDYPQLTFTMGEGALCAGELFTQIYENGYQNPTTKELFRKAMQEIMNTQDFAKEFPYFYMSFGQIMRNYVDVENKGSQLQQTLRQILTNQPQQFFWYIAVPVMLAFLNLLIQIIRREVSSEILALEPESSEIIPESNFKTR